MVIVYMNVRTVGIENIYHLVARVGYVAPVALVW